MNPEFSDDLLARLREAFQRTRYDTDGVLAALGGAAHAALGRGEPELAFRASQDAGELGTLIRLLLLGSAEPAAEVEAALAPVPVADALSAGLLTPAGESLRAGLDVRPHGTGDTPANAGVAGRGEQGEWWVISDLDSDLLGGEVPPEHVLGVGHASLSLVRATIRRPVGTLLDLGTGCGVQALHGARHAQRVTATDVSSRALALADATFRLNEVDVELLRGEWFSPVARRRFDQVVCNPPFVVGPPRVDYTYRDSGLAGDDASALVVRQLPAFLTDGGIGQLLASWLHVEGEDWADRVTRWLPAETDAWFVQRDVADPGLYVGTWLRDAGIDPSSPEGRAKAGAWLDWFADNKVQGVGFGFVTLRRAEVAHPTIVCEDLRQAFDDPLGPEAAGWLDRVAWLQEHGDELLETRFRVPSTVLLESVAGPGDEGWETTIRRLHRTDGPGWQHEVDEPAAALLAGCRGALPLSDLLELLSFAHGGSAEELREAALPMIRELVRHGMVEPA
ncbi:class I SAM-dependent methyltransferase [Amycolatopsis acidiphila]|uniref:Class I SAM-dependent methyltransferase n=1 Tax=Amycolatopsis acidiphila TaxID=715473 RepID=A0A558AF25_9PSEU|nr:class I SAM-dependent methyltransferase [Amycolatopsis acidiphila]TVT22861.1 class I SAM-dependent methyltransferase [Amycolatopsis acidiphila]UIJ58127.1 class I SAM-dependent methyltransferase [Amycolatopsis acidiphila]GHG69904.1 SAM-dependent methyltransferase [Amycolatopsis acidiphila]